MDVGCYCVSGSRLLLGEPVEVTGEQVLGPTGVDMSFRGALRFADGAVSLLRSSFEVPRSQELEVVGDEGRLRVAAPWRRTGGIDVVLERDGETSRVDAPEANMFQLELENLADAAAGVAPPLLGRADALGQARTIDALYRSAAEGGPVSL